MIFLQTITKCDYLLVQTVSTRIGSVRSTSHTSNYPAITRLVPHLNRPPRQESYEARLCSEQTESCCRARDFPILSVTSEKWPKPFSAPHLQCVRYHSSDVFAGSHPQDTSKLSWPQGDSTECDHDCPKRQEFKAEKLSRGDMTNSYTLYTTLSACRARARARREIGIA